ncbi:alpha/beta hydrolase fold-3 domain-containing protein [Xylariomycetidae sp. FL2044]|nr:alpha/beta hydrolase fold-3 domain-containing protein [Xylariomycetidae sp. FL2044]
MGSSVGTLPRRPWLSYQPLSLIYRVLYVGTILARTPWWIFRYALSQRWRQHPQWTFRQALLVRLVTEFMYMGSTIETPVKLSLEPGREKNRFKVIKTAPAKYYQGPLDDERVAPAAIGGTWFPAEPPKFDGEKDKDTVVVLHIHGGAFVIGDGRPEMMNFLATTYLAQMPEARAVFSPQYRLASRPGAVPFPGALQDVLTSYLYLVNTLCVAGENIMVSGDSAGANLIIGLLRYLSEFNSSPANLGDGKPTKIPYPRNAALHSPWTSPLKALWPGAGIRQNPNRGSDYVTAPFMQWGAVEYSRGSVPATSPWISPLGHPFPTPVPLFVSVGGAEVLRTDGEDWCAEMARVRGNVAVLHVEEIAPHDILLVAPNTGWEGVAWRIAGEMARFSRMHRTLAG